MTGTEYQNLAMRTCAIAENLKSVRLEHGTHGLAAEAGEVNSLMQKVYQGHELDKEHMKKELGDCLWFISEICTALDCTLDEVMSMNIDKLKARYPDGFEADKSLNRQEGDI